MSNAPTRPRVTTLHIDALKRRRSTIAEIKAGRLPTLDEIFSGMGFARGDWKSDCRLWVHDLLLGDELTFDAKDAFVHLRDSCTRRALEACKIALEHEDDAGRILERLDVYMAADNCPDAHARVIRHILGPTFGRQDFCRVIFGMAVARSQVALCKPETSTKTAEMIIQGTSADISMSLEAARMLAAMADAPTPEEAIYEQMEELSAAILEDRAEVETREPEPVEGIVVVPAGMPVRSNSVSKFWAEFAGKAFPTVQVGGVGEPMKVIIEELPHAGELVLQIAMSIRGGTTFRLPQPILIVGAQGEGKSTLAKSIPKAFGVPYELVNLAGASDNSIGGTSAQYSSIRESVFLQLIGRERVANPVVILDEIEKASQSRHNGSPLDVILPLLEKHTARRYRDPALEIDVDLSGISVIATANSLDDIPVPLRDRFKIYKMPKPQWQHVGALSRGILDRIAEEHGLDPRWFPDIEPDELAVIRKAWRGGSIRRLERAVQIILAGRDQYMGRA